MCWHKHIFHASLSFKEGTCAILLPNSLRVRIWEQTECSCWLALLGQGSRQAADTGKCPVPSSPSPFVTLGKQLNASAWAPRLSHHQLIHSSEILYKTSAVSKSPFTSWPLTSRPSMNPDERPTNESPLALPLKLLLGFLCPSSFSSYLLPISQEDKHRKNKPWDY